MMESDRPGGATSVVSVDGEDALEDVLELLEGTSTIGAGTDVVGTAISTPVLGGDTPLEVLELEVLELEVLELEVLELEVLELEVLELEVLELLGGVSETEFDGVVVLTSAVVSGKSAEEALAEALALLDVAAGVNTLLLLELLPLEDVAVELLLPPAPAPLTDELE